MTDKQLQSIGFLYACIILVVILMPHVSTLLNIPLLWKFSYVKTFIAILVMWAFMIFFMNKTMTVSEEELANFTGQDRLKRLMNNPPHWLFVLTLLCYAYGSYWGFMHMKGGMDPELVNGHYQTNSHGHIIYYTFEEYQKIHRAYLLAETGFLFLLVLFLLPYFFQ